MSGLSTRKQRLLNALLFHPTFKAAADEAGVSEATARRWRSEPEFRRALRHARQEASRETVEQLQAAVSMAVEALIRALSCGHTATEVRAACAVLDRVQPVLDADSEPESPTPEEREQLAILLHNWIENRRNEKGAGPSHPGS